MKIILIAGKAGSGKTYLGEKIVDIADTYGMRAIQTEYSKYLKLYAKEILGYNGSGEAKPRKFLQDIGSYIREDLEDEHFFTRRMLEDFRIYEKYFDIVVISDVRLLIEIEEILESKYDVVTVHVKNEKAQKGLTKEEKDHVTESEFRRYLDYDYVVNNKADDAIDKSAKTILEDIL